MKKDVMWSKNEERMMTRNITLYGELMVDKTTIHYVRAIKNENNFPKFANG